MKKIILFFSFLLIVLCPSFVSRAEMIPPSQFGQLNPVSNPLPDIVDGAPWIVPQNTLDMASGYGDYLPTYFYASEGLELLGNATWYDAVNAVTTNYNIDRSYHWQYKEFTSTSMMLWGNCYTSNGSLVPIEDVGLCVGQNDCSYCYFLYSKNTGELLKFGKDYEDSYSSLNGGVTDKYYDIKNMLLGNWARPSAPLAIYDQTRATSEEIAFYNSLPNSAYWYDGLHDIGCFVADVNSPDVYVRENSGYNWVVYYNDTGAVNIWNNWPKNGGGGWDNVVPQEQTNVFNGNTYHRRFPPFGYSFNVTASNPNFTTETHEKSTDVVYVLPQEPYELPDIINHDKQLFNPVNKHVEPNPDYNPQNSYTTNNFIFNITTTAPDVAPVNNYYNYVYNYYTTPEATPETELDPEELNTDVPILSNLRYRFPFSIPWDIHEMLTSLQAERRAPHIEGDIVFPVINYTWHVEIDLSLFNSSAELFRKCFLVLFVVGLALFSYRHHFGA